MQQILLKSGTLALLFGALALTFNAPEQANSPALQLDSTSNRANLTPVALQKAAGSAAKPEESAVQTEASVAKAGDWRPLFNGKDLTGWTPKIRFSALGEDPLKTFRVEDGMLCVNYDQYEDKFKARFGHLFYNCLLYTSPSPRDLSTARMPSSA